MVARPDHRPEGRRGLGGGREAGQEQVDMERADELFSLRVFPSFVCTWISELLSSSVPAMPVSTPKAFKQCLQA